MAQSKSSRTKKPSAPVVVQKRTYLKQTDVPAASLDEALRIPQAIFDHYAGKPTAPLYVAKALNVDPRGSQLKVLSGAAIAFGLIEGGAQATSITVTDLARRILRPKEEGADIAARREAVLGPRVFGEFLRNYDSHPFPRQDIALNVLEDLGVPRDKATEVLERIDASARSVGFIEEIKGKPYVSLNGISALATPLASPAIDENNQPPATDSPLPSKPLNPPEVATLPQTQKQTTLATAIADDERRRRVFVTHGKNRELVEPIKKLLEFGELTPVVSVERQSVSKPVPEKVMDDMRACGAAIIHVDADRTIVDNEGNEHVLLNPNVLIEIGAAMAFYGRRFILLVKDGVKLPSNLQGLYEVRYSNETLDAHATIKLLEAIKDIKNYALPTDILASEG
jgi:predicted nucleotide-binding protein